MGIPDAFIETPILPPLQHLGVGCGRRLPQQSPAHYCCPSGEHRGTRKTQARHEPAGGGCDARRVGGGRVRRGSQILHLPAQVTHSIRRIEGVAGRLVFEGLRYRREISPRSRRDLDGTTGEEKRWRKERQTQVDKQTQLTANTQITMWHSGGLNIGMARLGVGGLSAYSVIILC